MDIIHETCLSLDYWPIIKKDLTSIQMRKLFNNIDTCLNESKKNRVEHDSFICFILSNGKSGGVCGSDGKVVKLKFIFSAINASRMLLSKPKIFFIQACQGQKFGIPQPGLQRILTDITNDVYACFATAAYRSPNRDSFCKEACKLLCKYAKHISLSPNLIIQELTSRLNNPYRVYKYHRPEATMNILY